MSRGFLGNALALAVIGLVIQIHLNSNHHMHFFLAPLTLINTTINNHAYSYCVAEKAACRQFG